MIAMSIRKQKLGTKAVGKGINCWGRGLRIAIAGLALSVLSGLAQAGPFPKHGRLSRAARRGSGGVRN